MYRKIIKKLSNFKFTAMLVAIISGLAGVYGLTSMLLYHFAGPRDDTKVVLYRNVGFSDKPYLGMVLFFMVVLVVGISAFLVYSMLPYIQNKEKLTPKKGFLLTGFVCAFFELALVVFMIVLAFYKEVPNTKAAILATLPIGILTVIGTLLYIIPFLKCEFYMPEIKK